MTETHTRPVTRTHVVVIGGGYAGTLAANRLRQRPDVDVTLINARPQFVERIRLHQYATGTGAATVDYAGLLAPGVRLLVGTAVHIDAPARQVVLAAGDPVPYDYLVYAAGSTGATPAQVSGAARFSYPLAEFEDADRLRAALADRPEAPVVVIGGGLTGIEAATELAEAGRAVTLLCAGRLAPSLAPSGRRSVGKVLRRLGVEVHEASTVAEVQADVVVLADGRVLPAALTVWTVGFAVPGLATASGLPTDELGRLRTDETLTSLTDRRIVAAGDAAAPASGPLRMSCQSALPLGAQAANTVLARIDGVTPAPLDQAFAAQCISLGRRAGTVQLTRRNDTPLRAFVGGRLGAAIKETVCRSTVWLLRREAAKPGSYRWVKAGNRVVEQEALA